MMSEIEFIYLAQNVIICVQCVLIIIISTCILKLVDPESGSFKEDMKEFFDEIKDKWNKKK